ncbi:AmmeMemoRadiSam system protein B [Fodinibius salsisoli]|uniref:AmmeMemoRadiSam system protein B n=1 Tax=Fodinibius salsisoli TaxID=2820877 RepID=A0ABT3PP80_9BACT|nr:AmmeMemoRadiSam system protein B [Fodinibius salsisoli]MCW9707646.1 AmmeMemoRadiSam system protein B [Fodinibius salsisoli]
MSTSKLFNSQTNPIPGIRRDLDVIPMRENGDEYLYFRDPRQYAPQDFALHRDTGSLLSLLDGRKSLSDLENYLGDGVTKSDVLEFIQFLDKNRLLDSKFFKAYAQNMELKYEHGDVHQSVTAGNSYPENPEELRQYLDEAFDQSIPNGTPEKPKALYAPHIDPRVALNSYVEAFAPIKNLKPKRVVILATSHYAGWYPQVYEDHPFILVDKNFQLPLGTINRDQAVIERLKTKQDCGITAQDRAHRMEHSIELHLLFLSYLWQHRFSVVPFLVSSLQELLYMDNGHHGQLVDRFTSLLNNQFAHDDDTFFLISGDLAHTGKKFGDEQPASTLFAQVENFDQQFMDYGSNNEPKNMLELLAKDVDPYRICGFPPLYTFLNSMPDLKGEVLSYDRWDERERESAVTFGSILYSMKN